MKKNKKKAVMQIFLFKFKRKDINFSLVYKYYVAIIEFFEVLIIYCDIEEMRKNKIKRILKIQKHNKI